MPGLLFITWAEIGWIALALFILFNALAVITLSLTWLERKTLGRLQRRLGPTRSGPMGLLQPVADGIKLLIKEDIIPTSSEKVIFWGAPIIVMLSAFMIWVTIPGAQNAVIKNLDLGLFYIIAFSVVGILGLVLAGWGSANKYGTLGRTARCGAAGELRDSHNHGRRVGGYAGAVAESPKEIVAAPGQLSLRAGPAAGTGGLLHRRAWLKLGRTPIRHLFR